MFCKGRPVTSRKIANNWSRLAFSWPLSSFSSSTDCGEQGLFSRPNLSTIIDAEVEKGLALLAFFFLRRHCLFVPTATYMGFVLDFAFQSDIAMLTVEGLTGGLKRMSRGRARKRLVTQYSHAIHVGLHYFKCRMTNGFFPFGGLIRIYSINWRTLPIYPSSQKSLTNPLDLSSGILSGG